MKRRQVLQTAASSFVTALSVGTISRYAEASENQPLKTVVPSSVSVSASQGEVASVEELRKTRPSAAGITIKLRSWHKGLDVGGGEFVGSLVSGKDDGGVVFAGSGFTCWLSIWEAGSSRIESFGAAIDGSLKYGHITSRFRLNNNVGQETWFELGNLYSPSVGDSWEMELFGQAQYTAGTDSEPLMNPISGKTPGVVENG